MPARPLNIGGSNPAQEIPVTGGSLSGKLSGMPMQMMQAPGAMFGGQSPAGSPTAPSAGGAPQAIQMPGAQGGGAGQAQPIFGGTEPLGMGGGGGGAGGGQDFMAMLMQLFQQQPGMAGG